MKKKIYIIYYSKTGNIKKIAELILRGFSKLESKNVDVELMDAKEIDIEVLKSADGYVIGTPNYFGAPSGYIKVFFDELFWDRSILRGRPIFCFISHDGSGVIEQLEVMCNWLELKTVGPPIVVKGHDITSKIGIIEANIQAMMKFL